MPILFFPLARRWSIGLLLLVAGCSSSKQTATTDEVTDQAPSTPLHYTIDLSAPADDLFHVTLDVDDLGEENAVYQFASTAPGTYQVHDMGRYVRSFSALAEDGTEIEAIEVSTNQWRVSDPEAVAEIRYTIAETWDTPAEGNAVYPMSGTSIEADHALINPHAVLGYPAGMQDRPLEISILRDETWRVGTALAQDDEGDFLADDYDHVVDSPILLGRLSRAELDVRGSTVEIYTYSKTDAVQSDDILTATQDILLAAGEFLNELPVDRYVFLFHFEDASVGAWEHSYSSTYVLAEASFGQEINGMIPDIMAHEFFHVITPLNIHSEIIERFNFVEPVPSEHLWLYEGTTEWAAHIMQLRAGLITLDEYVDRMSQKMQYDGHYDQDYSLSKLSLTSYTPEGQKQYGNIYMRGAIVAGLLDLRLLQLSGGTRGLREVLLELSEKYGPERAFDEKSFFDEFEAMTYPEIGDFFDRYVRSAEPLPVDELYSAIGVTYTAEKETGELVTEAGLQIMYTGDGFAFVHVDEHATSCGFEDGDVWKTYNGEEVSIQNVQQVVASFSMLEPDVDYEVGVSRGGDEVQITCDKYVKEHVAKHVFTVDEVPSSEASSLREAWLQNLPDANP